MDERNDEAAVKELVYQSMHWVLSIIIDNLPQLADKFSASSGQITTLLYIIFIKLAVGLALCKFYSVYTLIVSKIFPLKYSLGRCSLVMSDNGR